MLKDDGTGLVSYELWSTDYFDVLEVRCACSIKHISSTLKVLTEEGDFDSCTDALSLNEISISIPIQDEHILFLWRRYVVDASFQSFKQNRHGKKLVFWVSFWMNGYLVQIQNFFSILETDEFKNPAYLFDWSNKAEWLSLVEHTQCWIVSFVFVNGRV